MHYLNRLSAEQQNVYLSQYLVALGEVYLEIHCESLQRFLSAEKGSPLRRAIEEKLMQRYGHASMVAKDIVHWGSTQLHSAALKNCAALIEKS